MKISELSTVWTFSEGQKGPGINDFVVFFNPNPVTVKVTFKQGERVRIIDGPFNDFRGVVSEIDMERTKVRVMVSFFGRETPVELDFLQVEKS